MGQWLELEHSEWKISKRLISPMHYARNDCKACKGTDKFCCVSGTSMKFDLFQNILHLRDHIEPFLRDNVVDEDWFDVRAGAFVDFSMPGEPGVIMTQVHDHPGHPMKMSCVFLTDDRLCGLEVFTRQWQRTPPGTHPWGLKPIVCWLYPLVPYKGGVRLGRKSDFTEPYSPIRGTCLKQIRVATPGLILFKEELTFLLGDEAYAEAMSYIDSE